MKKWIQLVIITMVLEVPTGAQASGPAPLTAQNLAVTLVSMGFQQVTTRDVGSITFGHSRAFPNLDAAFANVLMPTGPKPIMLVREYRIWWVVRMGTWTWYPVGGYPVRAPKEVHGTNAVVAGLSPRAVRISLQKRAPKDAGVYYVGIWYVTKNVASVACNVRNYPAKGPYGEVERTTGSVYLTLVHTPKGWSLIYSHMNDRQSSWPLGKLILVK